MSVSIQNISICAMVLAVTGLCIDTPARSKAVASAVVSSAQPDAAVANAEPSAASDSGQTGPSPVPAKIDTQSSAEMEIPLEINSEAAKKLPAVPVFINLDIPHHSNNSVTFCAAYPYPMPLPRQRKLLVPLSTKTASIKPLILQTSYSRKTMLTVAYPTGGWRWQNAYLRGLKRSGRDEPHVLTNIYLFINDVLPYIHEECKRINDFEDDRQERFKRAQTDYKETRADMETDAMRKGIVPIGVKYTKFFPNGVRQGVVKLTPGQWWIVATHKVPGLTYYWQQPLSVHPSEPTETTLNEDNALLIEGAW